MTRIVVSKVGPDKKIDVKINVHSLDKVEAYHTKDTLSSRVSLTKESGSIFLLPQETQWKEGEEVNILINYPKQVFS
ncbi:MAG: hypothetical protein AB8G05_02530 [Oligoflexales bacterium]